MRNQRLLNQFVYHKFYDGLGGDKLINDQELNNCFIKQPKICGHDLLSGLFDLNYYRKKRCDGFNNKKEVFLKYLDSNFKKYNNFSYPRTEYWEPKLIQKIEKFLSISKTTKGKFKFN